MNERQEFQPQEMNEAGAPPAATEHADKLHNAYERELAAYAAQPPLQLGGSSGRRGRRRSGTSLKAMLAAFLVGAVVVGGVAYAGELRSEKAAGTAEGTDSADAAAASLKENGGLSAVFEAASPAVVKIENYAAVRNDLFPFGGRQDARRQQQSGSGEPALSGSGTGFFIDEDGYLLTNEHVISGASELQVTVEGYEEPLSAKVVGANEELDLAVLKVESPDGQPFSSLDMTDGDRTSVGEWVIAIGNPYGLDHTMTIGVLSATEREITIAGDRGEQTTYRHLLQTDASINSGNSGGPLLNDRGQVIGMNTAVNADAQGIGFAIPASVIQDALGDLMQASS